MRHHRSSHAPVVGRATRSLLAVMSVGVIAAIGATMAAAQDPSPDASASGEATAPTVLWRDATDEVTGPTGGWTNKVEVADINADGLPDIIHANGGDYDTPGTPERQAVFLNQGPGQPFVDATDEVFGDGRFLARVIKARDVTGDGIVDLLMGTAFSTQSQLFKGVGDGTFEDLTETLLPSALISVGDLEVGDVDGDRDMDIVLADWGEGSPMSNSGGPVRLWRNTGEGWAEDAEAMPATLVGFSWDLELVDVDGDWDLDVATSCKMCPSSRLYLNDGSGSFSDVTDTQMSPSSNNYEFEPMDLDRDGDPDLATINDGPGAAERVLRNDSGTFVDATSDWMPASENPGFDDNVVAFLDVDSDADADFLVGSLDGPDRLMRNDGSGRLVAERDVFDGPQTPGTLMMAVADLDGDHRLDVVEVEGEVAAQDHVFLATDAVAPDLQGPAIDAIDVGLAEPGILRVQARIHDLKTPVLADDFRSLSVTVRDDSGGPYPLVWYGDALWRAETEWDGEAPAPQDVTACAVDRAGNESCTTGS